MENIAVKLVSEFNKIVMVYEKQFDELSEKENLTKLEIAIIGFWLIIQRLIPQKISNV